MPISFTQEFKISLRKFASTGAFNTILDMDSRFFIHPDLLKTTRIAELKNAYGLIHTHFGNIMKLLIHSTSKGDVFWRRADRMLIFPEFKGLCIGYSQSGTVGSGMGPVIRDRLLETAKQIIDAGIIDPEIFELVGIFEEDIGCDRISDMLAKIIRPNLLKYSERIVNELGIDGKKIEVDGTEYQVAWNRFNDQPIVLVPWDILDPLPEALSWDDISKICSKNRELREKVNALLGYAWSERRKRLAKVQLKKLLLKNPHLLEDLLQAHKRKKFEPYDFENDPAGEILWHTIAYEYAESFPLHLTLASSPTLSDVLRIVKEICGQFRELVENKGLWKNLYNPYTEKPFREPFAQRLFYTVAVCYCKANKLDITPESNGGRGPVDFKISAGYPAKVIVELKLSTNQNLVHGFEVQLPIYQSAEDAAEAIYLVLDFGDSPERMKELFKAKNRLLESHKTAPEIMLVDARPKKSASKALSK